MALSNYQRALGDAIGQTFCNIAGPVETGLSIGEEWYNNAGLPGFPSGPTPAGQLLRAAQNAFCNMPPEDVSGQFFQPFPSGQCSGASYLVTGDFVSESPPGSTPTTTPVSNTGIGPLKLVSVPQSNGSLFQRIEDANGDQVLVFKIRNDNQSADLTNINVTGDDSCGGPPEVGPPYIPSEWSPDINVTYEDNSGTDVTIPVGLVYAPVQVDVDGRINVPVRATFNTGVTVTGNLNLDTGDFIQDVDVNLTLPTPVTDPTVLPDPIGVPGNPPTDEESLERSIIAVYVKVTAISEEYEGTQLLSATAGSLFYIPRLASVSFNCEVLSAEGLAWTHDIDVKYTDQIVPCPVPWGAKGVAVTEQPGVSLSVTIIRGESRRDLWLRSAGVV